MCKHGSSEKTLYICNKKLMNWVLWQRQTTEVCLYIKTTSQIQTPLCKHFSWTKTGNAIRLNGVAESSSFKL